MGLHSSTFEYLKPTDDQMTTMGIVRERFAHLVNAIDPLLPDGPDKTYIMRELRTIGMWANVTITRNADGSPRA